MTIPNVNSLSKPVIRPESDGRSTRVDLMHDGKSVSRLWLTPFTLIIGEARVRMDGVGGVGTDDAYRSRGYSRRVLETAIEHMTAGDAALTMLYGIRDFYPKFGYATAGPDHIAILTDLDRDNALPPDWSVRDFDPDDLVDIQRLYSLNTSRAVGAALREAGGSVWEQLRKATEDGRKDACRVVTGPDGAIRGYLWRARSCWYVQNALETSHKRALVLGEVMADSPAAADAVLAACRIWAKEEPAARKINEVVLAFAPEGPLAAAAMRQDSRLLRNYNACGGSMARVLNVERLMRELLPELKARWIRACDQFEGRLELRTDIGSVMLQLDPGTISVAKSAPKKPAQATVTMPQFELARLALGAFPPEDVLARLQEAPSAEAARVLQALFPLRHPHMHLPDRY